MYYLRGGWTDFYSTVFVYNRFYAGNIWFNILRSLDPKKLVFLLLVLLPVGLLLNRERRLTEPLAYSSWLVGSMAIGVLVAVAAPAAYHPHYFQLWFPSLAVALGAFYFYLVTHSSERRAVVANTVALIVTVPIFFWQCFLLTVPAVQWSVMKYGPRFAVEAQVGEMVKSLTLPNEKIFTCGLATVYYVSQREVASGIFYDVPIGSCPVADIYRPKLVNDLLANLPELIVVYPDSLKALSVVRNDKISVADIINQNYLPLNGVAAPCLFFVRKNGSLYQRLSSSQMIKTK